jgi:hypothetical protein
MTASVVSRNPPSFVMPSLRVPPPLRRLLLVLAAPSLFAAGTRDEATAWEQLTVGESAEAHRYFSGIHGGKRSRFVIYGEAVSLLDIQPRTAARVDRAVELLDSLAASGVEDELTVPVLYLRARIEQIHRASPDLPAALRLYDELFEKHPAHPLAQIAAGKAAMIRIYTAEDDPLGAPLASAEALAPRLSDPTARASLHLMIANACVRLGDQPRRSLDHLEAALAAGIHNTKSRGNVLVRIGVLSDEFGRPERAIAAFEEFLREFARDDRAHTLRRRLAGLKSKEVAP